MKSELEGLYPCHLWDHFARLCTFPHPSKHEHALSQHIAALGRALGLETTVDESPNVIIRKPATPGMENRPVVCLQGHLDMVPQQNPDVEHEFLKDAIKPWIDGEVVRARGTTLGADNGIGVAAALSVLEAKDLRHGPLEALFTADEEDGMTGARNLAPGLLEAAYLLNLDSENENELCVGCAGGLDTTARLPAPPETLGPGWAGFEVEIFGLLGGHSGIDIGQGRGNADLLLARLLYEAAAGIDLRLATFAGGTARNAIPRESKALVAVPQPQAEEFRRRLAAEGEAIQREFAVADPKIVVDCQPAKAPEQAIRQREGRAIVASLYACPNGVSYMTPGMANQIETSSNVGVVTTGDGWVKVLSLQRSSVDSRKVELAGRLQALFELAGAKVERGNVYTGWKPRLHSPLLGLLKEVYAGHFGREAGVAVTHGGLECGIILATYPGLDAVSLGPNVHDPHTPNEHVEIASVGRFWDYLVKVLARIPAR